MESSAAAININVHITEAGKKPFLGEKISQSLKSKDLRALFSKKSGAQSKGRKVNKTGLAFSVLTSDFNQSVKEHLVSFWVNFAIYITCPFC